MKFNVRDRVRVVENEYEKDLGDGPRTGDVGVVVQRLPFDEFYPVGVALDRNPDHWWPMAVSELEDETSE